MLVFMSFLLMCKLKIRFDKFYVEYGCYLWTTVIIQALSLLIATTADALLVYSKDFTYGIYDRSNDVT